MKNYYYQSGTVVTFIYSIVFTMIVLTTLIPSTVGAATAACVWSQYRDSILNDYLEVRNCVGLPMGWNACSAPDSLCGSGGGWFSSWGSAPSCPAEAVDGGSSTKDDSYKCLSGLTVSPSGFYPEGGMCYAKPVFFSNCTVDTPTNLKGTAGGCGSGEMTMSWDANAVSGVEYEGYRADVGTVAQVGGATSFADTGLTAGASYTYYLRAKYRGAVSSYTSVTVSAPPVCPAASVNLNFI
jgi:hypothetical protein